MDEAMHPYRQDPSPADDVVEELMPPEFEWQIMVRRYPLAALALATLGGYVLGRHRGQEILRAFSDFAADTVSNQVNDLLGKDVL